MAQPPSNDELLVLKKRARRRLVGAVALVLIAIIVLWNVLDREPKTAKQPVNAQGVEIISDAPQISTVNPAKDKPASPFAEPGTPAQPAVTAATPAYVAPAAPVESPAPESKPKPAPQKVDTVHLKPEAKKDAPVKKEEHKAEEKHAPAKAEPKPAAEQKKSDAKPVAASDEHKTQLIQVAALSDAEKAKALVDKLAAHGVKAYTEQKGELTRVRVGPFASREQAEKALAKIQSAGASGVIVSK